MKVEFNNRVELQRTVLKIVNKAYFEHQLTGLSKPAMENWLMMNNIVQNDIIEVLFKISEKLFFIANKSQDQITEEYKNLQLSINGDIKKLNQILN